MATTPNYPAGFYNSVIESLNNTAISSETLTFTNDVLLADLAIDIAWTSYGGSSGNEGDIEFDINVSDGTNAITIANYTISRSVTGGTETSTVSVALSPAADGDQKIAYASTDTPGANSTITKTIHVANLPLSFQAGSTLVVDLTGYTDGDTAGVDFIDIRVTAIGIEY